MTKRVRIRVISSRPLDGSKIGTFSGYQNDTKDAQTGTEIAQRDTEPYPKIPAYSGVSRGDKAVFLDYYI